MVPHLREQFNKDFTQEKYQAYINSLQQVYPGHLEFRVSETPVFVSKEFTEKIISCCESIIDVISQPDYLKKSANAIPSHLKVPSEDQHPHCIAFDFGVCENEKGELEPQLIEMQGFPSLFAWEVIITDIYQQHFRIPDGYSDYLNGLDKSSYIELMKKIIIRDEEKENVILLEIFPHQQKNKSGFLCN